MTYRQSVWGHANGVTVFALGTFFWCTLGLGMGVRLIAPTAWLGVLMPMLSIGNLAASVPLLVIGVRLRRRARGFRLAEALSGDPHIRQETRRLIRGLRQVVIAEAVVIALIGFLCFRTGRAPWPWIGLALALHFLPFAPLFRIPLYFVTGAVATLVALVALVMPDGPAQTLVLGYGMGATMCVSGLWLGLTAERTSQRVSEAPTSADAVSAPR